MTVTWCKFAIMRGGPKSNNVCATSSGYIIHAINTGLANTKINVQFKCITIGCSADHKVHMYVHSPQYYYCSTCISQHSEVVFASFYPLDIRWMETLF